MDFGWSAQDEALRQSVRAFLDENLPPWWDSLDAKLGTVRHSQYSREFAPKLAERGWLTPHWPVEYGGSDSPAWHHFILGEEMWLRGEPRGPQYMNVNWVGPAIIAHGNDEQKARFLPPIAAGQVIWCQGFSEPEAGTDLASLRTRAVRDDDGYVVNGQKVWTSYANVADYCFLLVRTDPGAPKHEGISILLVPMASPGVEVREIPSLMGDHTFHELFFTDLRVPEVNRLGPENAGWRIVMQTLAYERVGIPRYCRAQQEVDRLAEWVRAQGRSGDPIAADALAEAQVACEAARLLVYRVVDERAKKVDDSGNVYLARAAMVQAERTVADVGVVLMGAQGLERGSIADAQHRDAIAAGIASGTYEVQLNLVARRHLGLGSS